MGQQKTRELHPSVLFPAMAPAGWDIEALIDDRRASQPSNQSVQAEHDRTQARLRELAAHLFTRGFANGLTPSEATDVILRNADYTAARTQYIRWADQMPVTRQRAKVIARQCFPEKLWSISRTIPQLLEVGCALENWINSTCHKLERMENPPTIPASIDPGTWQEDPLWFMQDPALPDGVVRGMLASHRLYALMATLDGLLHRASWNLPLIEASARLWVVEARKYLALLASLPAVDIPAKVVPLSERFDLDAAIAAQRSLLADLCNTAA